MKEKFEIGDRVQLQSGGPIMTVNKNIKVPSSLSSSEFGGFVEVAWFNNSIPLRERYHQDTLIKVD